MSNEISKIIHKIKKSALSNLEENQFIDLCEIEVKNLNDIDEKFEAVQLILKLFEECPDYYFGMPGELVRFVESFYRDGYEYELLKSIKRKPTPHTLWMLNRIINGSNKNEKLALISLLDEVLEIPNLDQATKESAIEFKEFHSN